MKRRNRKIRVKAASGSRRKSLKPLLFLVDFLNATKPEQLMKWAQEEHEPDLEALWSLHDQVQKDFSPIVDSVAGTRATKGLASLIDKINDLKLVPIWNVWPARADIFKARNVTVRNPGWKLGPGHGTIKVGRERLIVSPHFNAGRDPKKYLYGMIVSGLQSGTLEDLKRCQWEQCRKYFLRKDRRRKAYCSGACAEAFDRSTAAARVKKWRNGQASA